MNHKWYKILIILDAHVKNNYLYDELPLAPVVEYIVGIILSWLFSFVIYMPTNEKVRCYITVNC